MTQKPKKVNLRNDKLFEFGEMILFGSLSHISTEWRVIPLIHNRSIREFESEVFTATFFQFYQWVTDPSAITTDHPFYNLPKYQDGIVAVYADYKYFHDLFTTNQLITQDTRLSHQSNHSNFESQSQSRQILDWKDYDFETLDAENATFWIGSRGAHTPLHYDSYGRNVILQIYGEKKWSLWSPSEDNMNALSPSRIPYEESSIYSNSNKFDPQNITQLQSHPPDQIEHLGRNDVLYLPKHWWHYVSTEGSDISISMNMWIPELDPNLELSVPTTINEGTVVKDDRWDQLTESLCRFIFSSVLDTIHHSNHSIPTKESDGWYSPSENQKVSSTSENSLEIPPTPPTSPPLLLLDHDQNLSYIFAAIAQLKPSISNEDENEDSDGTNQILSSEMKKKILQSLLETLLHPSSIEKVAKNIIQELVENQILEEN